MTILPEVTDLLRQRIGAQAERAFVSSIARGEIAVEELNARDWKRVETLMDTYEFLGFVDASMVAVAERLKTTKLATTDRRHFTVVRPTHAQSFTFVP